MEINYLHRLVSFDLKNSNQEFPFFQNMLEKKHNNKSTSIEEVALSRLKEYCKEYQMPLSFLEDKTRKGNFRKSHWDIHFTTKWHTATSAEDELIPYQRAIAQVVQEVWGRYPIAGSKDHILEIGSGKKPIIDYLSPLDSNSTHVEFLTKTISQIHLSEHHLDQYVWLSKKYPKQTCQLIDLFDIENSEILPGCYKTVVMMSVLDMFPERKITEACQKIYEQLPKRGFLIHFSPRDYYQNALTDRFAKNDLVVFPILKKKIPHAWTKTFTIETKELEQKINQLSDYPSLKKMLEIYLKMSPAQRDDFTLRSIKQLNDYKTINFLTEAVQKLQCKTITTYDHREEFTSKMKNALEEAGFEIRCLENRKSSFIGSPDLRNPFLKNNLNQFEINNGSAYDRRIYPIAPGLIQEVANVHVIVAQKI